MALIRCLKLNPFIALCLMAGSAVLMSPSAAAQGETEPADWSWLDDGAAADETPEADQAEESSVEAEAADSKQPSSETTKKEPAEPQIIALPAEETPALDRAPPERPLVEEIIVTANKRAVALNDIAGSIEALSGEDLEEAMAQGLSDYIKNVPGVVVNDRGADNTQVIIRGIATSADQLGAQFTQLPVGIYVDDMPFADLYVPLSIPDMNPFDLERVEVLKGPQSVIFGSGALSGAVRYILKKPEMEVWETKLSATIVDSNFSEGLSPVYGAALNAPVGDDFALRLVGVSRENSGQIDDGVLGPDQDKLEQQTARALLQWEPLDELSIRGFHFHQDTESEGFPAADNPRDFIREGGSGLTFGNSGFSGSNLVAEWAFDRFDLVSSTNWITKDVERFILAPLGFADPNGDPDGDGGENGPGTEDAGETDAFSGSLNSQTQGLFQEIRLVSSELGDWEPYEGISASWQLGLAFQRSRQAFEQLDHTVKDVGEALHTGTALPVVDLLVPAGVNNATSNYTNNRSIATEKALYAEMTAAFGEHWELTLGGRMFDTALHVDGLIEGYNSLALNGTPQTEFEADFGERGFTPKAALRWIINDGLQFYGLASKGFQFGGVQLNPPVVALQTTVPEEFEAYKSSHLWNYEVGVRSSFFDRRLQLDAAAFYLDWTDLQITVPKAILPYVYPGSPNVQVGFTENIGKARSTGTEVGLVLAPWSQLRISSSASWVKAIVTEEFESTIGTIVAGTRLPSSPRFQSASSISYNHAFSALGGWLGSISLSHSYIGQSYNDLLYSKSQGDFESYDLALGLASTSLRGEPALNLAVVNLKDTRGISAVSGNANTRDVSYFFARPRSLMLSLSFRF